MEMDKVFNYLISIAGLVISLLGLFKKNNETKIINQYYFRSKKKPISRKHRRR